MEVAWWAWAAVIAFIVVMLLVDLLVFHREAHEVRMKEAVTWSIVWVACGLSFGGIVWATGGGEAAGAYIAGYLIEKSLSVDNIFVFALLFGYFAVPPAYQHRVLFWGVLGALVMRALFIAAGAAALERFHWAVYVFGGFLVITGARMAVHQETEVHPERNPMLRVLRRVVPMTPDYRGQRFLVRDAGRLVATPMLAVLVVVETTDVIFAVDSIPAIFAVTRDTFLVFTSNAFAILGLRALYFVLAGAMGRFIYLKLGLAAVLVYVGVKMLLSETYKIPIFLSLGIIAAILTVSIVASLLRTAPEPEEAEEQEPETTGGPPVSEHVLVFGDDGSTGADAAWQWVCEQRWPGWRAEVITAEMPPVGPPLGEAAATPHPWDPPSPRKLRAESRLAGPVHLLAEGDPRLVLARCFDAGLIVVGPRGGGVLKALHIGSTAEYLLAHPPAPLVVARNAAPVRRVVCAWDGSAHARRAIEALASMPWVPDLEAVTLVGVKGDDAPAREAEMAVAAKLLPAAEVVLVETAASVAGTILDETERRSADLVVLGTRGLGPVTRAMVGSVAAAVVRRAPCSVLLAHAEPGGEPVE